MFRAKVWGSSAGYPAWFEVYENGFGFEGLGFRI